MRIVNQFFNKIFYKDMFNQKNITKTTLTFFCLLFLSILFSEKLAQPLIYTKTISNINYNSLSDDQSLSSPKEFKVKDFSNEIWFKKSIDISCSFRLDHVKLHDNLFQTATANNGIRLEFNSANVGKVLLFNKKEGFVEYFLGKFDNTKFHTLKITKQLDNLLEVRINDKIINGALKETPTPFKVNKITVGKGFDNNRIFNGEIQNFTMKYKVYLNLFFLGRLFNTLSFFLLILIIFCMFKIIKPNKERNKFNFGELGILFALNLYPSLFLYLRNIFEASVYEVISFVIITSIIFLLIYLTLFQFLKDKKALFLTFLFLICFYYAGLFWNLSIGETYVLQKLFLDHTFIQLYCFVFLFTSFFIIKTQKKELLNFFSKILSLIILILFLLLTITNIQNIRNYINFKYDFIKNKVDNNIVLENTYNHIENKRESPDIYIIILDQYLNNEQLIKYFNFNNNDFLTQLENKGFFVAKKSKSNYPVTLYSLPSFLNYEYLHDLFKTKKTINKSDLLRIFMNNNFVNSIHKHNYHISYIGIPLFEEGFIYMDKKYKLDYVPYFKKEILNHSILFPFINFAEAERMLILNAFKYIEQVASYIQIKPKFIFAHILSPHEPYVFKSNGQKTSKKDWHNHVILEDGKITFKTNKRAYIGQLSFTNTKTLKAIETILNNNKNSVILLVSDHGTRNEGPDSIFANLCAVYFPDQDYSNLYDEITLVNLPRIVLNKYFNKNLSLLPDNNYNLPQSTDMYKGFSSTQI